MATINPIGSNKPIEVSFGGTGWATLTDHGVLVGSAALPITQLAVGTNGQVLVGSTGADPVFATITSTGGSIAITGGAGTLNLEAVGGTGAEKVHTISPSGADYTTIQAALTANTTTNTLFIVYPGTYSGDTINFTANNQTVIGADVASNTIVSAADGDIVNFGSVTGCVIENITVSVTGATATSSDCITGSTGSIDIKNCVLDATNASVAAGLAPACIRLTGAATCNAVDTEFVYTNNVASGGIDKGVVVLGANSLLVVNRATATVNCALASTSSSFILSASTGSLEISNSLVDITDTTGTDVAAVFYANTAIGLIDTCEFNVTVGAANTGSAINLTGTGEARSSYNRVNVTDGGGTSNSFTVAAGATLISKFDDVTAADGSAATGTYTIADLSSTGGTIDLTENAGTLNVDVSPGFQTDTGFDQWDGGSPYFDDTTIGQFTISQSGQGYIKGKLVTWSAPQTETGLLTGVAYYIYIDNTGTIQKADAYSLSLFEDNIVLFECLRDSTTPTNIQYTVKENHPYQFQPHVSFFCHEVIGTVIENNNNGANITLNGTQKIEIVGADELADHGLYTDIPDGGGTPEVWKQMHTDGAGKWATYTSSDTFDGYWNNAGTATAPTGNKFSVYRLYVSKDNINSSSPTYWVVLHTAEYNNLAAAQLAVSTGLIASATGELAELEFAQLGFVIYQQSISTIVDVIIEKSTLIQTISTGGTNDASLVVTDTTNFDGILSVADTTVQVALETIDEWGKTTTDHAVLIGNGTGSPIGSLAVGTNGQVIVGSTGADPVFANITSTGGSIAITEGAGTLNLETVGGTAAQNTHTISPSGGDYTTIQAALDDNVTADSLFLVYPGTYAADTINFTANNQSVVGVGGSSCASNIIITSVTADICDFGAFTDCLLNGVTLDVSGATSNVSNVTGSTGTLIITNSVLSCTNASASAAQPSCIKTSGASTVSVYDSCVNYTNNVAAGANVKVPFVFGANSVILLDRVTGIVACANAALGTGFYFSLFAADITVRRCLVTMTDTTATTVAGFYYTGAPGNTSIVDNTIFDITVGAANTGVGIFSAGTSVVSSFKNKITVTDAGGTSNSFIVSASTTINSKFDDIIAADGVSNSGTFTEVSSSGTGDLTLTGTLTTATMTATTANATTFDTNVAAAAVTLSGTTLSADGTDADIDLNITSKGTGVVNMSDISVLDIVMEDGGGIGTGENAADLFTVEAYDVDGATYTTFITLTANNTPTCDLSTAVTMGTNAIYYATGTDVPVTDGGTGVSTLTDHGVLVGSGAAAVTALAVGTNGQVLVGSTGADPVFATVASADGSVEITGGAGTIDLSVTGTIAVNNQTGTTYELVLADNGKIVTCTNAAAITVTIPVNADVALPVGTNVLISQNGAGTVTLAPEGGVTLRSRGALLDTAGQYAIVSATKIATNEWMIGGDVA
jgi:hypothetical protein